MKTRSVVVICLLAIGIAVAVSTLAAQTRTEPEAGARAQQNRSGGTLLRLDGRGARIGVSVDDLSDQELKGAAGAPSGVLIEDVDTDSPAAKAGLREGDIIVELDGERVRSARQFTRLIQETPEGRSVRLGIVRGGNRESVTVTPEASGFEWRSGGLTGLDARIEERLRDIEPRLRELEPRLREFRFDGPFDFGVIPRITSPRARLGVQVNALTPQLAEYFGAKDGGVLVSSVTRDSAAEKAGLKAGDVITSVNGTRVRDTDDLVDQLRNEEGEVAVGILRDRKEQSLKATLESDTPRRGLRRPA